MLLDGRRVLVTGAGSGIGRATAAACAAEGAAVALLDIDDSEVSSAAASLRQTGARAVAIPTDVADHHAVGAAVAATVEMLGGLDVIVSNAAAYATGAATELAEHEWRRTLDVCLTATWSLAHHGMRHLQASSHAAMVVVGSVHSIRGYPGHAAYQAAKAGLMGLTRSLAADYAPGVRVNAVLPGAVVTGLWKGYDDERRAAIARTVPLGRNADPSELASAVIFLASDMSSYVTGASLVVDGGLTAIVKGDS